MMLATLLCEGSIHDDCVIPQVTFSCDIIRLSPLSLEPSNTFDTGLKLVQRLRRWPSIRPISTLSLLLLHSKHSTLSRC